MTKIKIQFADGTKVVQDFNDIDLWKGFFDKLKVSGLKQGRRRHDAMECHFEDGEQEVVFDQKNPTHFILEMDQPHGKAKRIEVERRGSRLSEEEPSEDAPAEEEPAEEEPEEEKPKSKPKKRK